jgi:hypothetical protein
MTDDELTRSITEGTAVLKEYLRLNAANRGEIDGPISPAAEPPATAEQMSAPEQMTDDEIERSVAQVIAAFNEASGHDIQSA